MTDEKRKPGPIKQVVVDLLDDGMYTLCGYDENHMEVKKIGAHGIEDMVKKTMKMMSRNEK